MQFLFIRWRVQTFDIG